MHDSYNRIRIRNKTEIDNVNKTGFMDKIKRKNKTLLSHNKLTRLY